jgi:hypothetical protein
LKVPPGVKGDVGSMSWKIFVLAALTAAFLYELDKDDASPQTIQLYNAGLAGFDDNAPSYHLTLQGMPQMVWNFHSLLLCVKLLFSTMLTDDDHPLKMCRKCRKAFVADKEDQLFCDECR